MAAPNTLNLIYRSPLVSVHEYRCRPVGPDRHREEHSHEHGVVFLRSGVFERHIGRESTVADANGVLFFNAWQPYRVTHPVAGGDNCVVLRARPDVLAEMLRPYHPAVTDGAPPFAFPNGPCDSRAYLSMRALVRGLERSDAVDPLAVDETVLGLIAQSIGTAYEVRGMRPREGTGSGESVAVGDRIAVGDRSSGGRRASTRRAHADWAEHAKLVLAEQYRNRLSLDDVARAVHCSPYHLCRVFRRYTGASIHRYLTRLRLRASLDRLMDAGPDLTRLALDTGFSSHSHFTSAFAREFGTPPSKISLTGGNRGNGE